MSTTKSNDRPNDSAGKKTEEARGPRPAMPASGIFAFLLLAALFSAAYIWLSLQSAQERTRDMMQTVTEISATSVDSRLGELAHQLDLLGADLIAAGADRDWSRAAPLLARMRAANPGVNPVNITRPDGQILATSEKSAAPLPSIGKLANFQEAMRELQAGADVHLSRPFQGVVTHVWLIAIRHAVRDSSGRILFTVGAGLPLTHTQIYWNQARLPDGAGLGISRDDGYLLSRYPLPVSRSEEQIYGTPPRGALARHLETHRDSPAGWVRGANYFSGDDSFYAYVRLRHFPLTLFMVNPAANVWKIWWNESIYFFALLLISYLLAAVVLLHQRRHAAAWERARNRHVEELEGINKELEAFTYTVAHDLRAPLRAINGFAGLIATEPDNHLTEEARSFLQRQRQASERMGQMIDKMLEFARQSRQSIKPVPIDMEEMARKVAAELKPAYPAASVTIGPLPQAAADPELIRVVWENLIGNAFKYSREAAAPEIEIGHAEGRYFVRDNGVGFDMRHAARLFEVFTRLEPGRFPEGFGIGLATVAKVVTRHRGTVDAQAEAGKGARFSFSLGDAAP
ncbi:MAG TPA: ATP-binding protein [Burkholderiales bacterium]